MKLERVSPRTAADVDLFNNWMSHTKKLIEELLDCDGFDPMGDAELPAVSVLTGAAARAGYSPVAEYKLVKSVNRADKLGRADLWFNANNEDRAFEFKFWRNQHWGIEDLKTTYTYAMSCAAELPKTEAEEIYGGVIAKLHRPEAAEACLKFAEGRTHAYRIYSPSGYDLFLFFQSLAEYLGENVSRQQV